MEHRPGVVPIEAEGQLGEIVRAEGEEVGRPGDSAPARAARGVSTMTPTGIWIARSDWAATASTS